MSSGVNFLQYKGIHVLFMQLQIINIAKQGKTKQALLKAVVLKLEASGELVKPRMLIKRHALTPAPEFLIQ